MRHARRLRSLRLALCSYALACTGAIGCHSAPAAVFDLEGEPIDPLTGSSAATVLVFSSTECPIGNRYAPELRQLQAEFEPRGVRFWLVYPSARDTADKIRAHLTEYAVPLRAVRDPGHVLVRRAGARVTPEVAVFRARQTLAYLGRIDDRFVAFGTARQEAAQHDLENALSAVLAGKPVRPARTRAIGCAIAK